MKFINLCKVLMLLAVIGGSAAKACAQNYVEHVLWEGNAFALGSGWGENNGSKVFYVRCDINGIVAGDILKVYTGNVGGQAQIQVAVNNSDNGFDKNMALICPSDQGQGDYDDLAAGQPIWEYRMNNSFASYLNSGNYLVIDGKEFEVTKVSVMHDADYVAPDPNDPSIYKQGVHFFDAGDFPKTFEPAHSFDGHNWDNKLVFHPSCFPEFDSEHSYKLHVTANGNAIQTCFGLWSGGVEENGLYASMHSGEFTLTLNKTMRDAIAVEGRCFQLNGETGSISRVELLVGDKEFEPDFASAGFQVDGTAILDAYGNEFVMRGVNYSWAWQGNEGTIDDAARAGFNTIRIQLGSGKQWNYGSASVLEDLIGRCERAGIVCMFNVQDYTDSSDPGDLRRAVDYWCQPAIVAVMNAHIGSTILNINNEWPAVSDQELWRDGYLEALPRIRQAGYKGMMVVDCGGWGQDAQCHKYAKQVFESDPLRNTVFSIHMYQVAGHHAYYNHNLDNFRKQNLAIMIGEIAFEHKASDYSNYPDSGPVAWREILQYCYANNVSWIAWSWTGNGGGADSCDIYGNGGIQENGKCLMYGRYGMKETSAPCEVFSQNPLRDQAYVYPVDCSGFTVSNPECEYPYPGRDYADDDRESLVYNHGLPYRVDGSMCDFWIKSDPFRYAAKGDYLEVEVSNHGSDSRVEVGYFGFHGNTDWHSVHVLTGASENVIRIPLFAAGQRVASSGYVESVPDMIDHVRYTGMHVRGNSFTLRNAVIRNSSGNVITSIGEIPTDAGDDVEVYTVTGRRVGTALTGGVYIVRHGSEVRKIVR